MTVNLIISDTTAQENAVKGLTSRLERFFIKHGVKISRQLIEKKCGAYKPEFGITPPSWTRLIVAGLCGIGRQDRANYLINSFAVFTDDEQRRMNPVRWLEKLFGLFGEIQAAALSDNWHLVNLKKFELAELARVPLAV